MTPTTMADTDPDVEARLRRLEAGKIGRPTFAETWPLPGPVGPPAPPTPWELRQAEIRRLLDAAVARWEVECQLALDLAREDQERRREAHVNSPEYVDAMHCIKIDEDELDDLDRRRAALVAQVQNIDAARRPVIARLEANREVESRHTAAREPDVALPPKPGSVVPSPFAGHGGYIPGVWPFAGHGR